MSYFGPVEVRAEVSCGYEIVGSDDGTGSEALCDFDGVVTGSLDDGELVWTCPDCGAAHETNLVVDDA